MFFSSAKKEYVPLEFSISLTIFKILKKPFCARQKTNPVFVGLLMEVSSLNSVRPRLDIDWVLCLHFEMASQ